MQRIREQCVRHTNVEVKAAHLLMGLLSLLLFRLPCLAFWHLYMAIVKLVASA